MVEKILFFDAGPIITLIMSRLAWILPELKKKFGGKFYITPSVRMELVERPMNIKRFQFEALEVLKLIKDGTLEVYNDVPKEEVERLSNLANSSFKVEGKLIDLIQSGEMESVVCAIKTNAEAIVMDERTLRLFIENNKDMKSLLERRFKKTITVEENNMNQFSKELKNVKIIRSVELTAVSYKLGLLNKFDPKKEHGRDILLNSVLWAAKYNGSAVTEHEIEEIKSFLLNNKK